MFNPRQQLAHGYCVQAFQELVDEDKVAGKLTDVRKAAWCYAALALNKCIHRNCLLSRWVTQTELVGSAFDTHDFG